jgi:hypothetical protein
VDYSIASGGTMEESNRKKTSRRNHPSTRLADDKPINGMRLYIEEMDIYGNLENPHDDDDLSSIGNSISRYVDSGVRFLEDADGRKERIKDGYPWYFRKRFYWGFSFTRFING